MSESLRVVSNDQLQQSEPMDLDELRSKRELMEKITQVHINDGLEEAGGEMGYVSPAKSHELHDNAHENAKVTYAVLEAIGKTILANAQNSEHDDDQHEIAS